MPLATVLVVDDHKPTREEICALIRREASLALAADVGTGEDAVREAQRLHPDIVVMDIVLPGMNGVDATRAIAHEVPKARILAVSNHSDEGLVQALLDAGGLGYICKNHLFEELLPAIQSVQAGKRYLGQDVGYSRAQ